MYRKVLVVEDEAPFRRIIARNLEARGCDVQEAATAGEAMDRLSDAPDLILLDINLPDRSGWDVLRHLQDTGRHIPAVIVSAVRVSQERLAEFRPLGYLPKPFPIEALVRIVQGDGTSDEETDIA